MKRFLLALLMLLSLATSAHSATYYISPSGSNGNDGLSTNTPFLTFAHALNAARAWCGDTLILLNGTYGDGTSTGKISIAGLHCSPGSELTLTALNQRQAKIVDNGAGRGIFITSSSYIIVGGLYVTSTDNVGSASGSPVMVTFSHHITIKNTVGKNPNRYNNLHVWSVQDSQDVLLEDNEGYVFHRHCVLAWESERVVIRRQYCTPRGGRISGGYNASAGLGGSDTVVSMYPCKDCIMENSIADGRSGPMPLMEINATYGSNTLASGSRVLGSICYNCRYGNAIYLNSRSVTDQNHTPQNITIKDVAVVDFDSPASAIRTSDGLNITVQNVTVTGDGGVTGLTFDDSPTGIASSAQSFTVLNTTVSGLAGRGYNKTNTTTNWSGDYVNSYDNGTAFFPSLPANWANTSTVDPAFGACKGLWVPDESPLKGAGAGGSDIGATILYRYVDGVLTDIPLWDINTGEFPHGEADSDGTNRVAGSSLFDLHTALNVNTGGCPFPSGYSGSWGATNPSSHHTTSDLDGAHVRTIASGMDSLTVAVAVRFDGTGIPAHATGVTSSCGSEAIPQIAAAPLVTGTTDGHRSLNLFGKLTPTSGTCTLTPTFSSANVSGWIMLSILKDDVSAYQAVAASTSLTSSPSITAQTENDETVYSVMATSSSPTISPGANETFTIDRLHSTKSLRLASATQSGNDGGIMNFTLGAAYYSAIMAVSLVPGTPPPPTGSTFRISNYRIDSLHGTVATPEVSLGALAPQNVAAEIGATGEFRLRVEIIVENAPSTSTGIHPYCKKVGGSFVSVGDSFGSGFVRYYGAGAEPTIPASLTRTTQRFSGTFFPGYTSRDSALPVTVPVMLVGTRTEIDYQFAAGNGLAAGDVLECEIRRDDGSTLGTHTNPLRVNIVGPQASMGF